MGIGLKSLSQMAWKLAGIFFFIKKKIEKEAKKDPLRRLVQSRWVIVHFSPSSFKNITKP